MKLPLSLPHWRQLPLGLIAAFCLAIILLCTLGIVSRHSFDQQSEAADWVIHTYLVSDHLQEIYSVVEEAESAQRGFSSTGNPDFENQFNISAAALPGVISAARDLIRDSPTQMRNLDKLAQSIDARLALCRGRIDERHRLGAAAVTSPTNVGLGVQLMGTVRTDLRTMLLHEAGLLDKRLHTLERRRASAFYIETGGWIVGILLLVAIFAALTRQMLRAARAERAAEASNDKLKEANNELRAFSYSVAHDLRAPLRAINGFARIIVEDGEDQLSDSCKKALDRVTANAAMMGQLIDDLLALSKISYQPVQTAKVEMSSLVRAACKELMDGQNGRVVDLEISDLPPTSGDAALLRQVWINLISNALKFTRKRERAKIEIGGSSAGPEFVTYFIRDNGAGFNMQYANKLFGAFQRLHRPSDFEGTGIGLALVKRIIQRHGGTVWAEGKEDEGARFAFTLPEWTGK